MGGVKFDKDQAGPGIWYTLHLMAANAKDSGDITACLKLLDLLETKFFCERCRADMRAHRVATTEERKAIKNQQQMLRYTYDFHEAVNKRCHKDSVSWKDCKDYFLHDKKSCSGNCAAVPAGEKRPARVADLPKKEKRPMLHDAPNGREKLLRLDESTPSRTVATSKRSVFPGEIPLKENVVGASNGRSNGTGVLIVSMNGGRVKCQNRFQLK
jgi:hypothetical protein